MVRFVSVFMGSGILGVPFTKFTELKNELSWPELFTWRVGNKILSVETRLVHSLNKF